MVSSLTCEEGKSFLLMNIKISVKGIDCLPCSALDSGGRCLLMSYSPATAVSPQICLYMTASRGITGMLLSLSG